MDFLQNSSISGGRYDKITRTEQLSLFGRAIPVWLTTTVLRAYELEERPVDQEEAALRLEQVLSSRLEQLMEAGHGEVLQTDFVASEAGGRLTVTLLAECREEIGRTVERDGSVGRIYGTPQGDVGAGG